MAASLLLMSSARPCTRSALILGLGLKLPERCPASPARRRPRRCPPCQLWCPLPAPARTPGSAVTSWLRGWWAVPALPCLGALWLACALVRTQLSTHALKAAAVHGAWPSLPPGPALGHGASSLSHACAGHTQQPRQPAAASCLRTPSSRRGALGLLPDGGVWSRMAAQQSTDSLMVGCTGQSQGSLRPPEPALGMHPSTPCFLTALGSSQRLLSATAALISMACRPRHQGGRSAPCPAARRSWSACWRGWASLQST